QMVCSTEIAVRNRVVRRELNNVLILRDGIPDTLLAVIEIAERNVSAPVVRSKRNRALKVSLRIREVSHALVEASHAHNGFRRSWLEIESLLKVLQSYVILAERGV